MVYFLEGLRMQTNAIDAFVAMPLLGQSGVHRMIYYSRLRDATTIRACSACTKVFAEKGIPRYEGGKGGIKIYVLK
jgi:hypothetical protein